MGHIVKHNISENSYEVIASKVKNLSVMVELMNNFNNTHNGEILYYSEELPNFLKDSRIKGKYKLESELINNVRFKGSYLEHYKSLLKGEKIYKDFFDHIQRYRRFKDLLIKANIKFEEVKKDNEVIHIILK